MKTPLVKPSVLKSYNPILNFERLNFFNPEKNPLHNPTLWFWKRLRQSLYSFLFRYRSIQPGWRTSYITVNICLFLSISFKDNFLSLKPQPIAEKRTMFSHNLPFLTPFTKTFVLLHTFHQLIPETVHRDQILLRSVSRVALICTWLSFSA